MCVSNVRSVHGSSRSRFVWRSTTLRQTAVLCLSDSDHAANQIFQNQVWVGRRCLVLFVREKSDQKPCKRRQAEINQRPSPTPSTARCTAATGLCGTPTSDVRHAMCERSVPMLIRWMVMHTTMYQRFNISISTSISINTLYSCTYPWLVQQRTINDDRRVRQSVYALKLKIYSRYTINQ